MHLMHPERINPRKYAIFPGCIIAKNHAPTMHPEMHPDAPRAEKQSVIVVIKVSKSDPDAAPKTGDAIQCEIVVIRHRGRRRTTNEQRETRRTENEQRTKRETLHIGLRTNSEKTPSKPRESREI